MGDVESPFVKIRIGIFESNLTFSVGQMSVFSNKMMFILLVSSVV